MIPLKDNVRRGSFPFVNIIFIFANIAMFSVELRQPSKMALDRFISQWALYPSAIISDPVGNWFRVITSMFLHGSWLHIFGNMLYLWVFGDNVEDRVGHFRYVIFYILAGSCAAISQVYFNQAGYFPMIGASGAIAGVMGAYFVLYPTAKVMSAIPIFIFLKFIEIPAIFFLGFWFLFQALNGYGSLISYATTGKEVGGVAWWAHAGGFVSGILLIFIFRKSGNRK